MRIIITILLSMLIGFHAQSQQQLLPKIFGLEDGFSGFNIDKWETQRRIEILGLFEENVYGKIDSELLNLSFRTHSIDSTALCNRMIRKQITMVFSNDSDSMEANILLFLPKSTAKVPLFFGLNFYGNHTIHTDENIEISPNYVGNKPEYNIFNHVADEDSRGVRAYRWPVEKLIENGYGLATIYSGDLDPDYDDGFKNGIHKLMADSIAKSALSAWAFGLSCGMDYFEKDDQVDEEQVIVFGHSRMGKAALWAGACDSRFAMIIANNSGCGGAALSKRKKGETLEDINRSFPHWFLKNFHEYNNREEELPFDQHMLLSLLAPRPLYIASAAKDVWADTEGEYLALYHASEVYQLYNYGDTMSFEIPVLNSPVQTEKRAYHIRSGKHDITPYDWKQYIQFANKQFKKE